MGIRFRESAKETGKNEPWVGIFSYEGDRAQPDSILDALEHIYSETGIAINCVTSGCDLFLRYWGVGEHEVGDDSTTNDNASRYLRTYGLTNLSPSYFISNLTDAICNVDRATTDYMWFALENGKRPHMLAERRLDAR